MVFLRLPNRRKRLNAFVRKTTDEETLDHWSVRSEQIKQLMKKTLGDFGHERQYFELKIAIENSRIVNQNSLWNEFSVTCEMRRIVFSALDEQSFYSLLLVGFTNYCFFFSIRIVDHRCSRFLMLHLQIDYWTVLGC